MNKLHPTPDPHSPVTSDSQKMRAQAEELHRKNYLNLSQDTAAMSELSTQTMLHELRVHQIELEMQNDELRRIQSELDLARAHYFDLYDLAPVGYCTTTQSGMLVQINLTAAVMLGIAREQLTGKSLTRYIVKEDRDVYYLLCRRLTDHGAINQCELRMMRRDGTQFWVSMDAATMLNEKLLPEIRVVLIDITERRQAKLELQVNNAALTKTQIELETANANLLKTRQQLSSFIQHAPIGIAMFDRNMNYLACSDNWLKDFGHGRDNIVGCNVYELHPDLPAKWIAAHKLALAGSQIKNTEDTWAHADGSKQWVRWSLQPWLDESAAIGGIVIAAEDITERKLQEISLIENEQRLNGFFEAAMDAIITISDDYRILLFNPAAELMFGISKAQAIGASLDLIVPPQFHKVHRAHVSKFGKELLNSRTMSMLNSVTGIRANGEEFPLEATISFTESGGRKTFTVIVRDRTQHKRAEDEIRSYQDRLRGLLAHQLQIKEEERIRIAREIHDELGSALTGVKANLSVALHESSTQGQPANRHLLEATSLLDSAVDTVRKVITDLRPSILDQLGIWAALEWYAEQTAMRSGIVCKIAIDDAVTATTLDAERSTTLFRVTQESLTNVLRHAEATEIDIRITRQDDMIRMEIEDNGIGINNAQDRDKKSWGITGMVERIQFLGGDISITDTSHGTLLSLQLPLGQQDE